MKHPHAELIKQWADNTSLVIEYRVGEFDEWTVIEEPSFCNVYEYRIKPAEPKKVKLLAYLANGGSLRLAAEGSEDQEYFSNALELPRIPELDKEVMLP